jgi:hypothetical protein
MPEEGEEAMGEDHPRKKLLHRRLGDVETFLAHKKKLEDEVCLFISSWNWAVLRGRCRVEDVWTSSSSRFGEDCVSIWSM